jgi:2-polyprenyl-3-methyl-5-hydroxy-6-metoxy-1,4-benzoquinol methylase
MESPPGDMTPFYKGGYDPIPSSAAELRRIAAGEKYRTEPVLQHKSTGRCLEIGPWRGVICSNMKDAGFDVTAVEMDSRCVEFLREELGIKAIQSCDPAGVMNALEPGFDVIISWHSLEHIPNAWKVIEEASHLLAPGGLMLLAMPNPESFEFSLLKESWYHLDTPRHVCLFPISTLVEISQKNGFEVIEITSADKFSRMQSAQGWRSFVRSVVPIRYVRASMEWTVGSFLYGLTYLPQLRKGRGSAYTAVFRKAATPHTVAEPQVEVSGAV